MDPTRPSLSYRDAGVDIDAGDRLVDRIKPLAQATFRPGVLTGLGGFGALFELPLDRYRHPVLVSGTDGVGTKLRLAQLVGRHDTIGIDLVAMCANDVAVTGAEPLFFLDYYACGRLDVDHAATVIGGIARGCELAGCALSGGETAEMPGMYAQDDYDLAGFCVGVVERDRIIQPEHVRPGDVLLGLASSGPHSNGYSLVRRIVEVSGTALDSPLDGRTLGAALLEPTRIYVKALLALGRKVQIRALAHITGGGLLDNVPRILGESLVATLDSTAWTRPKLFDWLQQEGQVADAEMHRVFNCGIGMVVVVARTHEAQALQLLRAAGETAWRIGRISRREADQPQTIVT
mgnify:CR=1 FL=1